LICKQTKKNIDWRKNRFPSGKTLREKIENAGKR
jgi:hypothetical protein